MALTTNIKVYLKAVESQTVEVGISDLTQEFSYIVNLLDGVSNNQNDLVYSVSYSTTGPETIDLQNILDQASGNAISFAEVNAFIVILKSADSGVDLEIGGTAASNTWVGWVTDVGDGVAIRKDGVFLWVAPNEGAPVSPTSKVFKTTHLGGSTMDYDIVLIGRSS